MSWNRPGRYHARLYLGGQEAIARVRPEDRMPAGTNYRFDVDMRKAKLFDAVTGNHL